MKIIPYSQTLGEGCLAACFLMLLRTYRGIEFNSSLEQDLCFDGLKRCKEYYAVGIIQEISRRYKPRLSIYVDNRWFTNKLENQIREENVSFGQQKIHLSLIDNLLARNEMPIVYIDGYWTGKNYHTPHFIIIGKKRKKYAIIDPWVGKTKYLSREQLAEAITSLRDHLKYCPLIIVFNSDT